MHGKKFKLFTDHKAIEFLKTKSEFGSSRIQRWFSRFERFDFDVEYKKPENIICADALSRAAINIVEKNIEKILDDKIIAKHIELNHRKCIQNELKKINIFITDKKLSNILNRCVVCLKKDKKLKKKGKFIMTNFPGEKVAFDILEIKKNCLIDIDIDYFSRKIFGKQITSKSSSKILEFIQKVHDNLPIKTLITDNGKEFENEILKNWCQKNNINIRYSLPYYHQSNGRIERVNRTIRNAIKKVIVQ